MTKLNYFVSDSSMSGTSIIGLNERQILQTGCDNTGAASLCHCDPKMVETMIWWGTKGRPVRHVLCRCVKNCQIPTSHFSKLQFS